MSYEGYALKDLLMDSYEELQKRYDDNDKGSEPIGFETIEIKLNSAFDFFKKGGLYMLSGAVPRDNRECLMSMAIANIADFKSTRKVLVFLRKTDLQEWGMQLLSYASDVPMKKIRKGDFETDDWRSFAAATGDLAEVGVHLYESVDELNDCVSYCRAQYKAGNCFDVVVIDGLTLQEATDLDDGGEVRQYLSALAKDLQVSIVTSSPTYKGKKKPMLERVF
ncbi:DnaB-like helicase C-terminal domain-containing protein [Ghiorsea bivora]|uniref:DnaB-like helicase C-terminal domain-containing protein n=1 Tax=Ghiorsea bivora TaxID=1485545 RepID=UPI0005703F87|nr:DnaB-like helicase C-terminal domain-containing protein [Ghiorsea bivora]